MDLIKLYKLAGRFRKRQNPFDFISQRAENIVSRYLGGYILKDEMLKGLQDCEALASLVNDKLKREFGL